MDDSLVAVVEVMKGVMLWFLECAHGVHTSICVSHKSLVVVICKHQSIKHHLKNIEK